MTPPCVAPAARAAFAAYHARDASALESSFQHLTAARLAALEEQLNLPRAEVAPLLATVLLRRIVHRVLGKHLAFGDVGAALTQHGLGETIEELRARAGGSREVLWRLVMAHPMTAYVPVQCRHCGHLVEDESHPGGTDADVGISEDAPTETEAPLVRAGWYRGPRGPVVVSWHHLNLYQRHGMRGGSMATDVWTTYPPFPSRLAQFVLDCPTCGSTSRWFRSSAAAVTLNPNRWGRLCGEQEDARTALAAHLGVPLRCAIPLDWDHVWSEFLCDDHATWTIHEGAGDAPAANFAQVCRGVVAVGRRRWRWGVGKMPWEGGSRAGRDGGGGRAVVLLRSPASEEAGVGVGAGRVAGGGAWARSITLKWRVG